MSRYLLSEITSAKVYSSQGIFATSDAVIIVIYKNGVLETLNSDVCTEIGTTGNFYFDLSNITAQPTDYSELYWIMSDTTTKKESGLITAGGWVESLPQALTPASICRVTTPLYEADGSCIVDPNTFANQSTDQNHIELKSSYHDGTRYFKLGKFSPSFDELTGTAYWLIPQGSTVDVKLSSFGVTKTGALTPSQATIDLKTWLDSL